MLEKFSWRDLIIGASIFAVALAVILFYPKFVFDGMMPLVIVYALVISLMLGKALSNVFVKQNRGVLMVIGIGALMFFLSDLMLLFYVFSGASVICDYLCLALYYPAEWVLAFSVLLVAYNKNMNNTLKD